MAIIFDIDGTLADLSHRLHYISGPKKDYDAFFANVSDDAPCPDITQLARGLHEKRGTLILVSGRPEKTRQATEAWMHEHGVPFDQLHMRADGDYRPDYIVKSQILDAILAEGHVISLVIDDR